MADWWTKYEDSSPPIVAEGAGRFARSQVNADDPWAKYEIDRKEEVAKETNAQKEERHKKALKEAKTPWEKTDAFMNAMFGIANRQVEKIPGVATQRDIISPSLVKGIPVARHYVPQTSELSDFEEKHPWASTGLQAAGAVGSTLPIAGGAAAISGPRWLGQWAGQTAAQAPLNLADMTAQKGSNTTTKDAANALGMAGVTSMLPATVSSTLGQAARHTPQHLTQDFIDFMKIGGHRFPSGAPRPMPHTFTPGGINAATEIPGTSIPGAGHNLTTALSGIAGLAADHSPMGLMSGLIAGRLAVHPIVEALSHTAPGRALNTLGHHPSTQDIFARVLAAEAGRRAAPNLDVF